MGRNRTVPCRLDSLYLLQVQGFFYGQHDEKTDYYRELKASGGKPQELFLCVILMSKIKKVENQVSFPKLEDKITEFWKENKIFEKSVEDRDAKNPYTFVDGPPFVSGMPHYGHLLTSIAKDVVPRFWTMKGKRVRRVWGWDCHGLPIEAKVNKKFKITSSDQVINEVGVDKYVEACREYVQSTSSDWRWYIDKIGRWVDMDNAYYTMNPEFNESVIWAFKKMYEGGFIYKGKRVSLFSTDTSTPVSNFEVAMDADNYQDTKDLSIFVKFKLKSNPFSEVTGGEPVYVVAWTTTPWTIPSNVALAVNPKEEYSLVNFEGQYLVLATKRLEYTFHASEDQVGKNEPGKLVNVVKTLDAKDLEGLEYDAVFDYFAGEASVNDFKVYLYEGVTMEDGTGVLHLAPAFGEEDFNLGKKFELSSPKDIDDEGKLTVGPWKGTYLRDASETITETLEQKENLLRSEWYTHRLPYYRGDNPLIYMAQESYFVDIQKIKQRMVELNEEVNWVPDNIKHGRFEQTLATSPDWAISRNRFWATVMPIWKSEDGDEIVVGSFEEMMQYTDQIEKRQENGKAAYYLDGKKMSLHRDFCDKLVFKKDGKEYRRIPEVLDCWMDSGSVPFAEYHYPFENKEQFERAFPADFIVEYTPQVRAWFNVLFRVSTMIFDRTPYKNVICHGTLAGNDGRKMSKTYGNYPDAKEVLENIGAEAVRLYLMGSPLMTGGDTSWSDELLNEQVKNVLLPIWNTYKYLSIYADLHNWTPINAEFTSNNSLDVWLKNYMNHVSLSYSKSMENYNIPESVKLIQPAIDNISSWWIRRSRDRFADGDVNALQTLYAALVQFVKTFAPQMPFITEELYQGLVAGVLDNGRESVHLELFPEVDESSVDVALLEEMELVRKVCSLGQSVRVTNALKVRQPLAKAYVFAAGDTKKLRSELVDVVKDELNVKEVVVTDEPALGDGLVSNEFEGMTVTLDTNLTQELKEEGTLAELKRQLQNLRKTSGLKMGELVTLKLNLSDESVKSVVEKYVDVLKKDISLNDVVFDNTIEGSELKVDAVSFTAQLV